MAAPDEVRPETIRRNGRLSSSHGRSDGRCPSCRNLLDVCLQWPVAGIRESPAGAVFGISALKASLSATGAECEAISVPRGDIRLSSHKHRRDLTQDPAAP